MIIVSNYNLKKYVLFSAGDLFFLFELGCNNTNPEKLDDFDFFDFVLLSKVTYFIYSLFITLFNRLSILILTFLCVESDVMIHFLTGNHGDGHSTVTDTPLVVWGAGIKYPKPASSSNHDMSTPVEWGLHDIERVDVNQVDIAPLMVCIISFFELFIFF